MPRRTKQSADVYGQLLWDYYKGQESVEIVERDDHFITAGFGPRMYFSAYKDWSAREKTAMNYVRGRVLDIGCGVGRHSLHLQKKGHNVTGIDISPLAIKVCKLRGLKKAKVLSIFQVHQFRPNSFDSVIMMGNNFGLFGSFRRAKLLLKHLHRITSANGRIIAQTMDPYQTKDPDHLTYHKFNRKRERMSGQLRLRIRYRKFIGPWFDYLLVTKTELRKILEGTGWKATQFLDEKEGPSARYIMILEKYP